MGPELRHLRYLIAVAEHGNFTRAAEALTVSQPTLSQQIKQLERSVGAQLLDRSGRAVRLTDAGTAYVHYARRALRELAAADRAVLDVADLTRGHLRLAMTPTFTAYLLGPLVAALHDEHPGLTLEVHEQAQDRIEAGLLADEIDLGIAFEGPHLPGIAATALFAETLGLVATAHRPGADDPRPMPVDRLGGQPLALLSEDFATRRHIDAYFAHHRIGPPIAVEANTIQALTEIVRRTPLLATVLPDAITDDHPHLAPVPLDPPLPTRVAALLRRESAYRSAAARAFTRVVAQVVRDRGYPPA
ncbi:transcriptional regulator CynR [Streptomyces sp. NBC_01525]|uniref:Transcriptional regulator CynR n=1 Tax=Streptomyces benahoarensis TaxID=2595054 RepID=A0A553ZN04_9ACTN|nr:transcriptional regulator CynR [Streptomyces benahoarensis]TSB31738.1 transcriptional regulator CynR [Streptomyces benahoarensis]TSB42686.1 transcriptional regulator CynR [Streptomyces benahoarensis]